VQTKHQIQQLLLSAGVLPNKRLGQHFLVDLNLMRLLVNSSDIHDDDVVLEVGCGTGSLTEAIAEKAGCCIAVEFDNILAEIAKEQLAGRSNVEIINADILADKVTINAAVVEAVQSALRKHGGRFLLVSNLPYNAASSVMLNLVSGPVIADAMFVTVQKEVAERMTAGPGNKCYGTLSIFLSAAGDLKTLRVLKPTVFWPQPKIDSAMISFVRSKYKAGRIEDMELFSEVVRLFMNYRRKMLKGCVKFAKGRFAEINNWPEIFDKCSIEPTDRPEHIPPEGYIAIANLCRKLTAAG
jgi:16S rRNA (adenine1518-N6/adenine1519-N6)-dimethyltransferase